MRKWVFLEAYNCRRWRYGLTDRAPYHVEAKGLRVDRTPSSASETPLLVHSDSNYLKRHLQGCVPLIRKSGAAGLLGVVEAGKSALRATDSANIFCIVGPARSGKSTLANALFGDFLQETFTVRRSCLGHCLVFLYDNPESIDPTLALVLCGQRLEGTPESESDH
jgi:hypothetical protein